MDWKNMDELLAREVNRQEFLRYIGIGLLAVVGITNLLNNLSSLPTRTQQQPQLKSGGTGYGMSAYGR